MKPQNLPEFKALKKRYETITIEEITKGFTRYEGNLVANKLTGFGNCNSCSLCKVVCEKCTYLLTPDSCDHGINKKTFLRILNANTPLKLRNAFQARANHMQTILNKL